MKLVETANNIREFVTTCSQLPYLGIGQDRLASVAATIGSGVGAAGAVLLATGVAATAPKIMVAVGTGLVGYGLYRGVRKTITAVQEVQKLKLGEVVNIKTIDAGAFAALVSEPVTT